MLTESSLKWQKSCLRSIRRCLSESSRPERVCPPARAGGNTQVQAWAALSVVQDLVRFQPEKNPNFYLGQVMHLEG